MEINRVYFFGVTPGGQVKSGNQALVRGIRGVGLVLQIAVQITTMFYQRLITRAILLPFLGIRLYIYSVFPCFLEASVI